MKNLRQHSEATSSGSYTNTAEWKLRAGSGVYFAVLRRCPDHQLIRRAILAIAVAGLFITAYLTIDGGHQVNAPITVRFVGYTNSTSGPRVIFRVHNSSDLPIRACD